jgi:hypothetical protein
MCESLSGSSNGRLQDRNRHARGCGEVGGSKLVTFDNATLHRWSVAVAKGVFNGGPAAPLSYPH